ncbi:isomerase [Streptomyces javensis]|uniref:isomerase n=1 Tax=Streptomyces javensis TaxID=114698 RepID=UPI0033F7792B
MSETTPRPAPRTEIAGEDFEQLEQYVRFWNADAEPEQRRLAAAAFTDCVEYRAQIGILSGAQALMDFRNQFAAHMGTVALRLRQRPEVHHHRARLQWEILTGDGDGTPFAAGTDVLQLDENGRISSVVAFLDRAPEGFDPEAHHEEVPGRGEEGSAGNPVAARAGQESQSA